MKGLKENERVLMKGNEAAAYGAIAAGCKCYFGYPITPQNDIPELLSSLLPEHGGQFVQAESEVASANMLIGAASTGTPSMTSTSGPGFDLMIEAFSFMHAMEVPCVIVNMTRGGPGLGDIGTGQGDYFQAVKGTGHGDGYAFVLAPESAQEIYDMTIKAFQMAFKYRTPVIVLGDALVAQIKEPVIPWFPESNTYDTSAWSLDGLTADRKKRVIMSIYIGDGPLAEFLDRLMPKYEAMKADIDFEHFMTEDAELVVVSFGSIGRVVKSTVRRLRSQGHKVGVFRPKTLFPFPTEELAKLGKAGKKFLVIEQNHGQMIEDVRLALRHIAEPDFYPFSVSIWPSVDDFVNPIMNSLGRK